MSSEYLELEKAVAQLKADITVLENAVDVLKDKDDDLLFTINKATADILDLRLGLNDKFNTINNEVISLTSSIDRVKEYVDNLNDCVRRMEANIDNKIDGVTSKVENVSQNPLLSFTADFGIKKFILIITLLLSLLTSPTFVNELLEEANPSDTKLDKLIELLEKAEGS